MIRIKIPNEVCILSRILWIRIGEPEMFLLISNFELPSFFKWVFFCFFFSFSSFNKVRSEHLYKTHSFLENISDENVLKRVLRLLICF